MSQEMMIEVTVDGSNIVGPVTLDQARRGVAAGMVPANAHARPAGSTTWSPLAAFLDQPWRDYRQATLPKPPSQNSADRVPQHTPRPRHHGEVLPSAVGWQTHQQAFYQPPSLPPTAHQPSRPSWQSVHAPAPAHPALQQAAEQLALLEQQIRAAEQRLVTVRKDLESVEVAMEMQSLGFYEPRYGFETSQDYLDELTKVRDEQMHLIQEGRAISCGAKRIAHGSAEEERKMVAQQAKLMLRAFNIECDAAIAKVRYGNAVVVERRMNKAFRDINELGESTTVALTEDYYDLKLDELHLVHEHHQKVHEEKRRSREQMRSEQRTQQPIERSPEDAEGKEGRHRAPGSPGGAQPRERSSRAQLPQGRAGAVPSRPS